jgi:hypothetical protein
MVTPVQPGDTILTRGSSWTSEWIRRGAALLDKPNIHNHAIFVYRRDELNVLWGIAAEADGVKQVDLTGTLRSRWLLSNADQPKTPAQREQLCAVMAAAVGTKYDWGAIVHDGLEALRIDHFWRRAEFPEDGRLPYGTVCSALVDWGHERVGLANPGGNTVTRYTSPGDWDQFILTRAWELS